MAPKNGADESVSGLTPSEMRFIKTMFENMTQRPDADWNKVSESLGLKDAKCAKERFRQMSVKHGWRDQDAGASPRKANTGNKVTKPRTPRKKAVKKENVKDEEEEGDELAEA